MQRADHRSTAKREQYQRQQISDANAGAGVIEQFAMEAGFFLYDRRVWVKDATWENSRWHTMSYRSAAEFEYVLIFCKPGPTMIDRGRLSRDEWIQWSSRAVWHIPSVRANDDHKAKFPLELPGQADSIVTDVGDSVLDPFVGSGTSVVAAA